jgi:hypothetical protein
MRSGELFELPTWEPAISANDASSWPTARARDSHPEGLEAGNNHLKKWKSQTLSSATQNWNTPLVNGVEKRGDFNADRTICLTGQARLWRSPDAMLCGDAQDAEKRIAGGHALRLQDQVTSWGKPTTRDWKDGDSSQANVETNGLLGRQVVTWDSSSPLDRTTPFGPTCWCGTTDCAHRSHRRKLNPVFVEFLMGWPLLWTNALIVLEPAAMESWRYRARRLLSSLCGGAKEAIE